MKTNTILFAIFFLLSIAGCNGVKDTKSTIAATDQAFLSDDEPCWVSNPSCASTSDNYIYFSGQSDRDYPSYGRPERKAFESARKDARQQYANYLGVEVTADTTIENELNNGNVNSKYGQISTETLKHTVSHLQKVDEYFTAATINKKGERSWRVFVLMRVAREKAEKFREKMASKNTGRHTAGSKKPGKKIRKVNGFEFQINKCEYYDDGVICEFIATNKKNTATNMWFDNRYCYCLTDDGDEYIANRVYVGQKEHYNGLKHTYQPDSPVKFKFRCPNVNSNVEEFHSVKFSFLHFPDVIFRNVEVQH